MCMTLRFTAHYGPTMSRPPGFSTFLMGWYSPFFRSMQCPAFLPSPPPEPVEEQVCGLVPQPVPSSCHLLAVSFDLPQAGGTSTQEDDAASAAKKQRPNPPGIECNQVQPVWADHEWWATSGPAKGLFFSFVDRC